jgi:hypothetical protein
MSGNGLLNYRNADPSLPYQPAGAMGQNDEGQVSMPRMGSSGGQFLDRFVPLPNTENLLGRPLRLQDVVVGLARHHNAKADLADAIQRRGE